MHLPGIVRSGPRSAHTTFQSPPPCLSRQETTHWSTSLTSSPHDPHIVAPPASGTATSKGDCLTSPAKMLHLTWVGKVAAIPGQQHVHPMHDGQGEVPMDFILQPCQLFSMILAG